MMVNILIIYLIMFVFLIGLWTSIVNGYNHTKCLSLSNRKCTIQSTLTNLHPNGFTRGLRYYPLAVNLCRCAGRCNTLFDLSKKVCIPNKTDLDLSFFNMNTGMNKWIENKVNVNYIVENISRIEIRITIHVGAILKIRKNIICVKKIMFGIQLHVVSKMVNI